jgi:ribosomal protein S18 acetylase RimI-like enzyme
MAAISATQDGDVSQANPAGETIIRKATLADVASLTALHCKAFAGEGHAAIGFGESFIESVYRWQVSGANEFVLIAEEGGRLAGFVAMSRGNYRRNILRSCWPSALRSILLRPSIGAVTSLGHVLARWVSDRRRTRDVHHSLPDPFELSYIAVNEEFRGAGIASRLLAAAENEVVARGGRTIVAGVYKINLSSRRAFTKAGWTESAVLETENTVTFLREGIGLVGAQKLPMSA